MQRCYVLVPSATTTADVAHEPCNIVLGCVAHSVAKIPPIEAMRSRCTAGCCHCGTGGNHHRGGERECGDESLQGSSSPSILRADQTADTGADSQ